MLISDHHFFLSETVVPMFYQELFWKKACLKKSKLLKVLGFLKKNGFWFQITVSVWISKCGKILNQISLCAGSKGDSFQKIVFCCKIRIFFRITSETQKVTVWYRKKVIYREESLWNSEQCSVRNGGPYEGAQEV